MRSLPFQDSKIVGNSVKSLSPNSLDRSKLNPISLHNARKDMQYAIAEWLRMDPSPLKKFRLTKLLENPTVDFNIQHNLKVLDGHQIRQNSRNRFIDHRRLAMLKPVIDQAAELGDMDSVVELINRGLNVTEMTLLAAAESGKLELLKYLIQVSNIQPDFHTLIGASLSGRTQVVKYLVEQKKIQPSLVVLNVAARLSSLDIIRYLITHVDSSTDLNMFVLKPAALSGRLNVVKYILKTPGLIKKDPGYQAVGNMDLLEEACESGSEVLVKYLIHDYKLHPSIRCLNRATMSGNLKLVQFLIQKFTIRPTQETYRLSFISNAFNSDLVRYFIVRFLMEGSIDILHKAGEKGDLKFAKYLMEEFRIFPDVELLHRTCSFGHKELSIYLIEEKNVIPDDYCLEEAAWSGNLELVEYLIAYGLKPTSLTLHFACRGADNDLKNDHSPVIEYISNLLDDKF